MENIDHVLTREIVCPHCGEEIQDSDEFTANEGELECDACGGKFYYGRDVEVTYTTHKINEDGSIDYCDIN